MNRERFLVKSFGDNIEGTRAGLVKLVQLLEADKSAVIVVPQLSNVKDTMLVDVLGENLSKSLIRDREIILEDNKKISLCSQATLKNFKYADSYLALWGSDHTIELIEGLSQWTSVVLVTWLPKDSEHWEKSNNVNVIYDDKHG